MPVALLIRAWPPRLRPWWEEATRDLDRGPAIAMGSLSDIPLDRDPFA